MTVIQISFSSFICRFCNKGKALLIGKQIVSSVQNGCSLPSCEKAPYHIGYWLEIEEKLTNLQKSPSVDLLVEVTLEFINLAKFDHSKYILPVLHQLMKNQTCMIYKTCKTFNFFFQMFLLIASRKKLNFYSKSLPWQIQFIVLSQAPTSIMQLMLLLLKVLICGQ